MRFLPFEKITYSTKLKEEEILKRLKDLVDPAKSGFSFFNFYYPNSKPYAGKINGNQFKIKRRIFYRNSFLPVITGNIEQDILGTTVHIKMRLTIYTTIFLCFWCAILVPVSVGFLVISFTSNSFDQMQLIPWGMLLFAYVMTMVFFKIESRRSIKDLKKAFDIEVIE
jgi:hypothetical protein